MATTVLTMLDTMVITIAHGDMDTGEEKRGRLSPQLNQWLILMLILLLIQRLMLIFIMAAGVMVSAMVLDTDITVWVGVATILLTMALMGFGEGKRERLSQLPKLALRPILIMDITDTTDLTDTLDLMAIAMDTGEESKPSDCHSWLGFLVFTSVTTRALPHS